MEVKNFSGEWFEVTVKYDKVMENGEIKKVPETISINATSFTEAESKAMEEFGGLSCGEFMVTAIKIAKYKEVIVLDEPDANLSYYNAKVAYITIDEKTAKEKKTTIKYLIGATDYDKANDIVKQEIGKMFGENVISGVSESKVTEIYS